MSKTPRFFSQNGEDWYIWTILGRPQRGFIVEVGAFDGIYLSNSYALEQMGWRALCVEPHPRFFDVCRRNRPSAICVHAACVGDPSVRHVDFAADALGIYSGLSVSMRDIERKYAALGRPVAMSTVRVPALTLDEILETSSPSTVDVLSIDTEGHELDVLSGLDPSRHRPRVLLAEANSRSGASALRRVMARRGYSFLRRIGNVNYAFTCDDSVAERARGVSIRCELEALVHPEGIESTASRYRRPRIINESASKSMFLRLFGHRRVG